MRLHKKLSWISTLIIFGTLLCFLILLKSSLLIEKNILKQDKDDMMEAALERLFDRKVNKSRTKRLPDVIGIGVKKCGTGALVHFLSQHPLIQVPRDVVEINYFNQHYRDGLEYYINLMPNVTDDELVMEKSPAYCLRPPEVPYRIKETLPNVKLILLLCNPTIRAFSDFVHESWRVPENRKSEESYFAEKFDRITTDFINMYGEDKTFNDTMTKDDMPEQTKLIFLRGMYYKFVVKWMQLFKKNLLIINGDEWLTDPGKLIERIQRFLDIPMILRREDFVRSREDGFYCLQKWWGKNFENRIMNEKEATMKNEELFCLSKSKGKSRNGVRSMLNSTYLKLKHFYEVQNTGLHDILGGEFHW